MISKKTSIFSQMQEKLKLSFQKILYRTKVSAFWKRIEHNTCLLQK